MSSSLALSLVVALLPVLAFYIGRYLLRPRPVPNIVLAPGALPLFGHSLSFLRHIRERQNMVEWFYDIHESCGRPRLAQFMVSWNDPCVIISDPEQIDRVHASGDWDKSHAAWNVYKGLFPKAMIGRRTDDIVKAHRRSFAYMHSPAFLALAGSYFSAHFDLLLAQWSAAATQETIFPVAGDLKRLMTDVIAQISFGESFKQVEHGQHHEVANALDCLFAALGGGAFAQHRHWLKRIRPSYKHNYAILDRYIASRVALARTKIRDGGEIAEIQSLIDVVMRKEARDGEGNVMPENELRDELILTMIAGEETSASAQLWSLKILADSPDIQQSLNNELSRVLPLPAERAPTAAEVQPTSTPYLEAVVHEILRFQAVAPWVKRQAIRDTTLLSSPIGDKHTTTVHVPAGTTILLLNAYASSAHVAGGDGRVFRPERWLDEKTGQFDATRVWSGAFAGGNRMCYGYKMALVFLRLFIAQLSLAYFVAPLPDELRTKETRERITRRPAMNYVKLRRWADERGAGI